MKSLSLLARLILLQVALAAVIIAVFAGSAVWLSAHALERAEARFLSEAASLVAQSLERESHEHPDLAGAAKETLAEDTPPGVRIDILDPRGQLVLSTSRKPYRPDAPGTREQRIRVSNGATVIASVPTRPMRSALSTIVVVLAITAVPLFLLVIVLSRTIASRALRPLSRMTVQAERTPLRSVVPPLGRPTDPSEVRALASAFNRLVSRLEESLRAEQHFTEDAAHELRTPITVLSGELEYALSDASLSDRHRKSLASASEQVRQIRELVDALLMLRQAGAERTPGLDELAAVNLGDLVEDVSRELVERNPRRASDIEVQADDEVLVEGHATLIQSAIRNLLSNAFKFTREGQRIRAVVSSRDGQGVIVVEDGGPGIPAGDRDRIFDPFFRGPDARAEHEGFGLGLPILRRVARAHGGDVVVLASDLGGARFEFSLPRWTEQG